MMANLAKLQLVTLNVRGIRNSKKRKCVFKWLNDKGFDIICIQESFITSEIVNIINNDWNGPSYHCISDSSHSRGVSIFIKNGLDITVHDVQICKDARRLLINLKYKDQGFTIVNMYAPNIPQARKDFFFSSVSWIKKKALYYENLYVVGDFNCCIYETDRVQANNHKHINDKSGEAFKSFINRLELIDTWKLLNSNEPGFTWFDPSGSKSRIDYCLSSEKAPFKRIHIKTIVAPIKDRHRAVVCTINACANTRGPGYFKLNTAVLTDEKYIEMINQIIENTSSELAELKSKRLLWDIMKVKIKESSIKFCQERSQKQKLMETFIEKDIQNFDCVINSKIDKSEFKSIDTYKEYLKYEYEKIYNDKAKGSFIRSRCDSLPIQLKNFEFFSGIEKSKQNSNCIKRILNNNGNIITTDNEILQECSNYYKLLYTSTNTDIHKIDKYLKNTIVNNILSDSEKKVLEQPITEKELKYAVFKTKSNKSPGLDGIPFEFYHTFWDKIHQYFIDALNESYSEGRLSYPMSKSVLTLIFKKGDASQLQNYRPISLTGCDYRILASVLAHRINKVLGNLIHADQTGYIRNRFIGTNIRRLLDILDCTDIFDNDASIILLDFKKAFDSVEWNFIYATLKKFNFGDNFIKWVTVLYKNANFSIKNNGWISKEFKMTRGIRQGCPVSALLFILVVEILAINIRNNKNINGIKYNFNNKSCESKISQYADDSALTLADKSSILEVIKEINSFSAVSGLELNLDKCEGFWLNKNPVEEIIFGIPFKNTPVKYLGVYIGIDKEKCCKQNWDTKLEKLKSKIDLWNKHKFNIFEKVEIIKTFLLPKFSYLASVSNVPDYVSKDFSKQTYGFIWNKRDRIKRNTLIGPITSGGINMLDFDSHIKALHAAWIPRLISASCSQNWPNWALAPLTAIHKTGLNIKQVLDFNTYNIKALNIFLNMPLFYKQTLTNFSRVKFLTKKYIIKKNPSILLNHVIWNNDLLKVNNKFLFIPNWIKSGIIYIKDLFYTDGSLLPDFQIKNKLINTQNWIAELFLIKNAIKPYFKYGTLINNNKNINTNFKIRMSNLKYIDVRKQCAKDFYRLFVDIKFIKPITQKYWKRTFETQNVIIWKSIYEQKIINMCDKKVSEFNYKILNNLVTCKSNLMKWKLSDNDLCDMCGTNKQDTEHMLFTCPSIQSIWVSLKKVLKLNITWKLIVFGITDFGIQLSPRYNGIISVVCYCIYKTIILKRLNLIKEFCFNKIVINGLKYRKDCSINDDVIKKVFKM